MSRHTFCKLICADFKLCRKQCQKWLLNPGGKAAKVKLSKVHNCA